MAQKYARLLKSAMENKTERLEADASNQQSGKKQLRDYADNLTNGILNLAHLEAYFPLESQIFLSHYVYRPWHLLEIQYRHAAEPPG